MYKVSYKYKPGDRVRFMFNKPVRKKRCKECGEVPREHTKEVEAVAAVDNVGISISHGKPHIHYHLTILEPSISGAGYRRRTYVDQKDILGKVK